MSNQIVCDDCGQPIDTALPYYNVTGQKVKNDENGVLVVVESATQLDFHEEHVPWLPENQPT